MDRVGLVYFNGEFAGRLSGGPAGYRFEYDRAYLAVGMPISASLPLREEPYQSSRLMPFFDGLLAEGWMLEIQTREQGLDPSDRFGLLLNNGRDTIGAVTVIPEPAQ